MTSVKKLDTQNDTNQTRRWRKRRKLHIPCLNFSDTENSEPIGDFKINKCVIKHNLTTDDFKRRIYGTTSVVNSGKLQEEVEVDSFKLFMPNVFKPSSAKQLSESKQKPSSTTYEQLGLSKNTLDKRNVRPKKVDKKQSPCVCTTDSSIKKYKPVWDIPQKKEEIPLSELPSAVAPVTTASKPWMQFCRNAQKALSVLNDEVSTALRDSFCSIDDIQMRIRRTMDEIRECDKMYEHLKTRQKNLEPGLKAIDTAKDGVNIFKVLGLGLIPSRSENQMRVDLLPSIEESIYETEVDHTNLGNKRVEEPSVVQNTVELEEITSDSSVKQMDIAPFDTDTEDAPDELIVPTPTPVKGARIDDDMDLHRKRGQWNLHNKSRGRDLNSQERIIQSEKSRIQIVAEELYVPEKVNRIASTNLNNTPTDTTAKGKKKSCQFLYREKTKKTRKNVENDIKKSSTSVKSQMKYADSVLFAKRNKKKFTNNQPCSLVIQNVVENDCKLKQEFKSLTVQSVNCKTGLDCFDILDEITLNDLKPLESEYPRKDNLDIEKAPKQIKNTYLYKLVYGPMQDEFLKLLRFEEPSLRCAERCEKCVKTEASEGFLKCSSSGKKPQTKKLKKDNTSDITLGKGVVPKQKRSKRNAHDDIVSRLKPYMFDPHMRYPTTITVMPAMITTYTNPNFVKNANKALAEKNQVGDYAGPTRYTSKLNKPIKYLNEKKKTCPNKPLRPTNLNQINRFKPTQEKMHGDAWDDYEAPSTIPSSPKTIKRRTFRSNYESYPNPILKQPTDLSKFKQQKIAKPNKWEANIQSVIEMIETKIVEILSDPEKTHLEAFKSVEMKILEILSSEKSLDVIEEGSQVDIESDKIILQKSFRSKTMDNLKKKDKKIELRSKTDVGLNNFEHYPLECGRMHFNPVSMVPCNKGSFEKKFDETTCTSLTVDKVTSAATTTAKSPTSEFFQFLDSISSIVSEDVVQYNTKKVICQYPSKVPSFMLLSQVYYQISNYGIYSKKFVEQKHSTTPPKQTIVPTNSKNPCLTASTHTYKILSSNHRRIVSSRQSTITRPKQEKNQPISNNDTISICQQLTDSIIYNRLLNFVYATLFAIVFFGLTFNYTCD